MKELDYAVYRKKLKGCFIGKSVGGTLGMPFEGRCQVNNVTYYDPVPDTMIPNDDLDLQVSALEIIMRTGLPVSRFNMGDTWRLYNQETLPDEYGVAEGNYQKKIYAPLSGRYNNKFHGGMGAAIRSELWACLAPGNPDLAVKMAIEDGCTDHADDGIHAIMFLAALESMAFTETDVEKMIEKAISYIPEDAKMGRAFRDAVKWYNETKDPVEVRSRILENYSSENWTDVTINVSFILTALLHSKGDFDTAICTATNLGHDADCTAATVGSIVGILNPEGISEKWTKPIGDELLLSYNMINVTESATIGDFCDEVAFVAEKVMEYYNSDVKFENLPKDRKTYNMAPPRLSGHIDKDYELTEALIAETPLTVGVVYPETVAYCYEKENNFKIKIENRTKTAMKGTFTIGASQNVIITPYSFNLDLAPGDKAEYAFNVKKLIAKKRVPVNTVNVMFSVNGLNWDASFGFPDAKIYHVENLETGEKYDVETPFAYFTVPKGKYRYTLNFIPAVSARALRISHNGKAKFDTFLNGEKIHGRAAGLEYVPAFHRGCCSIFTPERGENKFEFYFDNDKEAEAFIEIGSVGGCGRWVTFIQYV